MTRSYTYGPVPSRRLGFSLGVDLLPFKTCSMDCIYCQLGPGSKTTIRRRVLAPERAVLAEVKAALRSGQRIEAITFSGSGEPTLHVGLGRIIRGLKRMTRIPVVVLTNSSTLARPDVRKALAAADIVVPSLDAATERVFRKINRPHPSLAAAKIVAGLVAFRRTFPGRIWLEILFVKGVNDSPAHLQALRRAIEAIAPDRVQVNTVVRPPAEKGARPLSPAALERIRKRLGPRAEIIARFESRKPGRRAAGLDAAIRTMAGRRPVTAEDIAIALGASPASIKRRLGRLLEGGILAAVEHAGKTYYQPVS